MTLFIQRNNPFYENIWIYICLSIAIIPPTQNFYQKWRKFNLLFEFILNSQKLHKYAIISHNFFGYNIIGEMETKEFEFLRWSSVKILYMAPDVGI